MVLQSSLDMRLDETSTHACKNRERRGTGPEVHHRETTGMLDDTSSLYKFFHVLVNRTPLSELEDTKQDERNFDSPRRTSSQSSVFRAQTAT